MMHKDIFAEGLVWGDVQRIWRVWAFRKSGVLIVREGDEDDSRDGLTWCKSVFVEFDERSAESPLFFIMSESQRKAMEMPDSVYHELNMALARDYDDLRWRKRR